MAKQSFLLLNLQESKAKNLAKVLVNDSCRKILDYLTNKDNTTASDIARQLSIPLPTVHYNLQHLLEAGLILSDEYHYSEKGKEVNHYKLANKYIIIAPKTAHGIKERLKAILPISLLALVGSSLLHFYQRSFGTVAVPLQSSASPALIEKAPVAQDVAQAPVMEALKQPTQAIIEKAPEALEILKSEPNLALWFLSGCISVIVLIILFEILQAKKQK